jgi:hypothetical protein
LRDTLIVGPGRPLPKVFQPLDTEARRFLNDERRTLADSSARITRRGEETTTHSRRVQRQEKLLGISVRAVVGIHEFADRLAKRNRVYPHASRDTREHSVELRMTVVSSACTGAAQSGVPR